MSIDKLREDLSKLFQKLDEVITKLDTLIENCSIKTTETEIASAKIIADITKNVSTKIETSPYVKQNKDKKCSYKGLNYYSPPSMLGSIGNKDLAMGKDDKIKKLIHWPTKSGYHEPFEHLELKLFKPDEKDDLLKLFPKEEEEK